VESDSNNDHIKRTSIDQLRQLRYELGGVGFSSWEIDNAFEKYLGEVVYSAAVHERQRDAAKIATDEFGRIIEQRLNELVEVTRETYESSKNTSDEKYRYGVRVGAEDAAGEFDHCIRSGSQPDKLYKKYRERLDSNIDEALDFRSESKPDEEYSPEYWNGKLLAFLFATMSTQGVMAELKGESLTCASCGRPINHRERVLARCYTCDSPVHSTTFGCDNVHECSYCGRRLCDRHAWTCTSCNKMVCIDHKGMNGICDSCDEARSGGVP